MQKFQLVALFAISSSALFAQSDADSIAREIANLPSTPAIVTQRTFASLPLAGSPAPAVMNIFTVLGDNVLNSGLPCYDCVSGVTAASLGILKPLGTIHADGTTSYALNNYIIDNSFTGTCNFTFLVRDAAKKYIVKLGPVAIPETSGSPSLLSTSVTIPNSSTVAGLGLIITSATCGTLTTSSSSPVFIAFP